MYTDSVISRFGKGLKHAAFFLGMLLKIVTTVAKDPKVSETTMDIKEMRRKYEIDRAKAWEFPRLSRDPGNVERSQISEAERGSKWAMDRFEAERSKMGEKDSGSAIMVFEVRSKEVRLVPDPHLRSLHAPQLLR
jgi:hypothetical protein